MLTCQTFTIGSVQRVRRSAKRGICVEGSARELRERLTSYMRSSLKREMDTKGSSFAGGSNEERGTFSEAPQGLRDNAERSVLSDLLKDVLRLTSEEPKAILKFFVGLKAIHELYLVPDNVFLMRFLHRNAEGRRNISALKGNTSSTILVNILPGSCSGMCVSSCNDSCEEISIKTEQGTEIETKVEEVPEQISFPEIKAEPDENCNDLQSGELRSHGGICATCSEVGNEVIRVCNINSEIVTFWKAGILWLTGCLSLLFQTMRRFSGRRHSMIFAFDGGLRELILHRTTPRVLLQRGLIAI